MTWFCPTVHRLRSRVSRPPFPSSSSAFFFLSLSASFRSNPNCRSSTSNLFPLPTSCSAHSFSCLATLDSNLSSTPSSEARSNAEDLLDRLAALRRRPSATEVAAAAWRRRDGAEVDEEDVYNVEREKQESEGRPSTEGAASVATGFRAVARTNERFHQRTTLSASPSIVGILH